MNMTRVHGFSCRINDAKCFQVNGKTFTDPLAKQTENALVRNQAQIFCANTMRLPPVEIKPRKNTTQPFHRHKRETTQPIKTTREVRLLSKLPFQEKISLTRKNDETQRLSESRIKQIVDMDTDHCHDEKVPLRLRKLEQSVEKKQNRPFVQRKTKSTKQADEKHVRDNVVKKKRINPKRSERENISRDYVAKSNNTLKNDTTQEPKYASGDKTTTADTPRKTKRQIFSDSSDTNNHSKEIRGSASKDENYLTEVTPSKLDDRTMKDQSRSSTGQSPRRKINSAEAKRKINCAINRPRSFSAEGLEEDSDKQILNFEQYLQRLYSSPNTYALEAVQSANLSEYTIPVSATKCLLHNRYLDTTFPATPVLREFTRLSNYNESDEETR